MTMATIREAILSAQNLPTVVRAGRVLVVVVYKVDRLTRSLGDFTNLIEVFERRGVSLVSVTQQSNTTTSLSRLMSNVLLSLAQSSRGHWRAHQRQVRGFQEQMYVHERRAAGRLRSKRTQLVVNREQAEVASTAFLAI
jgi:DNA invertase Pin-like site-specific DNA recombinase